MGDENNIDNGDEEFQGYLDEDSAPVENQLTLIILTIEKKSRTLIDLFTKSAELYVSLEKNDPLKDEVKGFLSNLIKNGIHTLDQYDYALINDDPNEDMDEEDSNGEEKK